MRILPPSLIIIGLFVIGGMMFKSMAPTRCGTILPNDNIFVLTGDLRRIPFAMRQIRRYPDTRLYIIGSGTTGAFNNNNHIIIESDSKSTYQNAQAIRNIANRDGLNRIVLITTEDHINRARYLIKSELPDVEVVLCPVALTGMPPTRRLERWTTEYIKYLVTMLGIKES